MFDFTIAPVDCFSTYCESEKMCSFHSVCNRFNALFHWWDGEWPAIYNQFRNKHHTAPTESIPPYTFHVKPCNYIVLIISCCDIIFSLVCNCMLNLHLSEGKSMEPQNCTRWFDLAVQPTNVKSQIKLSTNFSQQTGKPHLNVAATL